MAADPRTWILGIDLGSASIGWAAVGATERVLKDGTVTLAPKSLIDAGVRIFEAGVEGDIEAGKDSSRAAVRREARQPRRQNWRTRFRKQKLFGQLQQFGLLPTSDENTSETRKAILDELDGQLTEQYLPKPQAIKNPAEYHQLYQKLPYILRAKAVAEPVDAHTLGRALYHLAQRRGFLSNRKSDANDDDEAGKVKTAINEFHKVMGERTYAQTVTESVTPADGPGKARESQQSSLRIRGPEAYLDRKWITDEFDEIHQVQGCNHNLTEPDWETLRTTIFYQRPLKSQKHAIAFCNLERKERCTRKAFPAFQQFRIRDAVANLRIDCGVASIPLDQQQFDTLVSALQNCETMTHASARRVLKFPRSQRFTAEREHKPNPLYGDVTGSRLRKATNGLWDRLSHTQQDNLVELLLDASTDEEICNRVKSIDLNLSDCIEGIITTKLETKPASYSLKAINELIPYICAEKNSELVRRDRYPDNREALNLLPPVTRPAKIARNTRPTKHVKTTRQAFRHCDNAAFSNVSNPAVVRALTELRKVVNDLIRRYGKPARIHIETARELKNSREARKKITQQNKANKKARDEARKWLTANGLNDSELNILKFRLWEECGKICPYTGESICVDALFGTNPQFDIEHILPRRCLDDSFANKTLCRIDINRLKGDTLPSAFLGDRLDEVLQRVARFDKRFRETKLRRFKQTEVSDDFVAKQLNDTRYNARLAAEYVSCLYPPGERGGEINRVLMPTGVLTSRLRGVWKLNQILSPSDEKERGDNRHHAIDAVVIALTSQRLIQRASQDASRQRGSHRWAVDSPIEGMSVDRFRDSIRDVIEQIVVSYRPTRSVTGPLHAETIYSPEKLTSVINSNRERVERCGHHIPRMLKELTPAEIKGVAIVDPIVREAVKAQFKSLGFNLENPSKSDIAKAFSDAMNHPHMPSKSGCSKVPIHKVRVHVAGNTKQVAANCETRKRHVMSGQNSNFASMVYAVLDKDGNETKWEHDIIDRLTAYQRLSENKGKPGEKILIPDEQEGRRRFKFALLKNDTIELDGTGEFAGQRVLYRVQKLSQSEIQLCPLNWTGVNPQKGATSQARSSDNRITSTTTFKERNAVVVKVSPSGQTR